MANEAQFLSTAPSGSDSHWIVSAAVTPSLILSASQDQRAHASIFNDAVGSLYLRFGGNVAVGSGSLQNFDVKLTSGSYYELPKPIYEGEVWGAWDATGGWARILSLGTSK